MKISIPEKKSTKWFLIFLVMVIFMTIIFLGIFSIGMGNFGFNNLKGFFILSLLVSLTICWFGYYGAKYIFLLSFISNIIGLIYMTYSFKKDYVGWGTLIGYLGYFQILIIGSVVGSIIQLVLYLKKYFE